MIFEFNGIPFQYICEIIPESDESRAPKEYMPQLRYESRSSLSLHEYGNGPFCRFKIPKKYKGKTGVYIILVDGNPKYIGECKDLEMRFNMGYGIISPRNCYEGGQPTNCRINTLILKTCKSGSKIELLFYEAQDRFDIERTLIEELNPDWNKARGISTRTKEPPKLLRRDKSLKLEKRKQRKGKYNRVEEYLIKSQKQVETLSYEAMEKILGFRLPASAYNHRTWWANSWANNQAKSWLNAGWQVSSVELGKSITFRKEAID